MTSDPNVGVPDADVYGANVRVRAPEVCPTCGGDEWVSVLRNDWGIYVDTPCPTCSCRVCGVATDVLNGECGQCFDRADRYESRKESSR